MEGKKKKGSGGEATRSIADELFGKKEEQAQSKSSSAGYFNAIFPPATTVMQRQRAVQLQSPVSEGKQKSGGGGSSKKQSTYKDGEVVAYSTEPSEPCYYGSSVHYGGRDFYSSPTSTKSSENTTKNYQNTGEDDPNYATRGDWWQGSLYY